MIQTAKAVSGFRVGSTNSLIEPEKLLGRLGLLDPFHLLGIAPYAWLLNAAETRLCAMPDIDILLVYSSPTVAVWTKLLGTAESFSLIARWR